MYVAVSISVGRCARLTGWAAQGHIQSLWSSGSSETEEKIKCLEGKSNGCVSNELRRTGAPQPKSQAVAGLALCLGVKKNSLVESHVFFDPKGHDPKPLNASGFFGAEASSVTPRGEVAIPANEPIGANEDEG